MSTSHSHGGKRQDRWNICAAYCLTAYLITLLPMAWFIIREIYFSGVSLGSLLCLCCGFFSVTALLLLPVWGMAVLGKDFKSGTSPLRRFLRRSSWYISGLCLGFTWCYIGADIAIYHHFGFHFNGLVLNLLTTRGGLEAMGLDLFTIFMASFGIFIVLLCGVFLAHLFISSNRVRRSCAAFEPRRFLYLPWTYLPATTFTFSLFLVAFGEFYDMKMIVKAADAFPMGIRIQMSNLLTSVGLEKAANTTALDQLELPDPISMEPEYPLAPIQRRIPERLPNIIWLACESLRPEMLSAKYMPETYDFISNHGIRFANHYSGGNGTRPSVFSMFYGLYATAWDSYLSARRGALLFDWLMESDYRLLMQNSARFTYPEFDRTIFSSVPAECMTEEDNGATWQRDITVVDRLLKFMEPREENNRPFFGFIFFDSTHSPYSFPPDQIVFKPVMEEFSYTSLGPDMREQVYNRAANGAYHLDRQIGRIITFLKEKKMLENTIIIINGDHGEEFYEKGRLGHNSAFVDEQIRTPLAMHLPGKSPRVHEAISHHCDIVPTIAGYLGVCNPPSDYSVGGDLLNGEYQRENLVVCGWRTALFVNPNGKLLLPINAKSRFALKRFLDADDNAAGKEEMDDFYRNFSNEIEAESVKLYHCLQSADSRRRSVNIPVLKESAQEE
ncbi:MAG: sulfatase-like hydrolase/transferase [Victivallales bacterium]|nr:sulfatase-like hydrolase/transferase [Victivallales bacterium]